MPRRDRNLMTVAAIGSALAMVGAALAGHVEVIAYAAPLVVLLLPLISGRYVGEERILAARVGRRPRNRRRATALKPVRRLVVVLVARGGRLIADSLAVRPPPVVAHS